MKLSTDFTLSKFFSSEKLVAYYELTKPGITLTVVISMVVGFVLGSGSSIDYLLLLQAAIGTTLIAAGTAAHNQFMEWRLDGKMKRTQQRPLPSSKITPEESMVFSISLIFSGLLYLMLAVNVVACIASLATTVLYLFAYTPLKRVSAVNIVIGAIPGALPVVGGWAAATGQLDNIGVWLLFGIVFFWQIPHVIAIAWVCKDDYQHAGFHMLPANDPKAIKTVSFILLCLLMLLPITWALYTTGLTGILFLSGALLSSLVFLGYGLAFAWKKTKDAAKKLMFASFAYLPVIWFFAMLDQLIH